MNVLKPHAEIDGAPANLEQGIVMLKRIEEVARLAYRSGDRITVGSWEPFLRSVVVERGHWSITEHEFVRARVLCDRGISHEWVRHRVPWQYTQESTRYCNYGKISGEIDVIEPPGLTRAQRELWRYAVQTAEDKYLELIKGCDKPVILTDGQIEQSVPKASPQIARSVLPTCLATRFYATANLRGWRHFFLLRTSREAHPQMREVTVPLLDQFKVRIPLFFDDITPEEPQSQAMRRAQ